MASTTATSFVVDICCPGFRRRRRKRRPRRRRRPDERRTRVGDRRGNGGLSRFCDRASHRRDRRDGFRLRHGRRRGNERGDGVRQFVQCGRGRVGEPDHRSGLGRRRGRRWTCWAPTAASAPSSSLTNAVHGTTPGDLQLIQIANGGGGGGWDFEPASRRAGGRHVRRGRQRRVGVLDARRERWRGVVHRSDRRRERRCGRLDRQRDRGRWRQRDRRPEL